MYASTLAVVAVLALSARAQIRGTGDLFNFEAGLGACGVMNTNTELVASVSSVVFSSYPNATANPNKNPICKHHIVIKSGNKTVTAPIVDFYVDKATTNVGLTIVGFRQFANDSDGIVHGVSWTIV